MTAPSPAAEPIGEPLGAPIRVLLVDDHAIVRAGFRTILQSDPGIVVVGEAADGAAAIESARTLNPDVICMDVEMPGLDGLAATRAIVADPRIRSAVLMLTTFDREDYLFTALRHGASGFLLKNSSPEALVDAVQVLARGDALLSTEVTRRVIERFVGRPAASAAVEHPSDIAFPHSAPVATLTDREREVFLLLARGLSNQEIAHTLYIGATTVKSHVSKVLLKLDLRDRVQAVVFAHAHQLV